MSQQELVELEEEVLNRIINGPTPKKEHQVKVS